MLRMKYLLNVDKTRYSMMAMSNACMNVQESLPWLQLDDRHINISCNSVARFFRIKEFEVSKDNSQIWAIEGPKHDTETAWNTVI